MTIFSKVIVEENDSYPNIYSLKVSIIYKITSKYVISIYNGNYFPYSFYNKY
jgi:hypothetical protein